METFQFLKETYGNDARHSMEDDHHQKGPQPQLMTRSENLGSGARKKVV